MSYLYRTELQIQIVVSVKVWMIRYNLKSQKKLNHPRITIFRFTCCFIPLEYFSMNLSFDFSSPIYDMISFSGILLFLNAK